MFGCVARPFSLFNGLICWLRSYMIRHRTLRTVRVGVWVTWESPNHRANFWVCRFYVYKRQESEKNVPGVLRLCMPVAMVRGVLCRRMQSCPICRWSPWKLLKFSCFLLMNTLRLLAKKCILRFGLTARIACLQIGRLINSSANSLKRCNENYICWNRKCSNRDVNRLS